MNEQDQELSLANAFDPSLESSGNLSDAAVQQGTLGTEVPQGTGLPDMLTPIGSGEPVQYLDRHQALQMFNWSGPKKDESGKPIYTDGGNAAIMDNGAKLFRDKHIEFQQGDKVFSMMGPLDTPRVVSVMKSATASEPYQIMEKKAAEKGILRADFPQGAEGDTQFNKAAKSSLGAGEASDIADAIMSGTQPPDLKGLYRQGPLVKGELARRGYDLTNAQTDWTALQRHIAASNSTPIFKLRSSAETAYHSLDIIDDLAGQWKAGAHMPVLNKANLILAKNGTMGPEAASLANQLDGQINDVTAELANVYMGGGTPTDHSIELAKKGLSSEWDEHILKDMTGLARKNLQIRLNSLKTIGPAGSGENAYAAPAPTVAPTATPAPSAVPVGQPIPKTVAPNVAFVEAQRVLNDPQSTPEDRAAAEKALAILRQQGVTR